MENLSIIESKEPTSDVMTSREGERLTYTIKKRAERGIEQMAQEHSVFSNIQDNRTSSLAEQVADQINQVIIDQNINAGEKLPNEFELASRLNVGRGTIREAVKILVARNCLEIRRGKGTFVVEKPGQIEDPLGFAYVKDKITLAVDLMELRLQLEPWVAQLAAQRIEENEKDTLRQLCEQVEHKIRSGEDHGPADKEFHAYVARCTHNSVITEIMPVITYSIEMFTKFKAPRLLGDTIRTHWQITEAICANDPQKAYDSMYEHVSENRESIEIVRRMSMEQNQHRDN